MSPIYAISSATSRPTTALLQLQMLEYTYIANSPNWKGKADYEALQTAIDAGNVSAALVALGRLQKDGKVPTPNDGSAASATSSATPQTISDIPSAPSGGVEQSTSGSSINTTA